MDKIKPFIGIKSFSKNKDGALSIEEILEMADSSDDEDERLLGATHIMKMADKNYDGKITKEEFVKAQSKLFEKSFLHWNLCDFCLSLILSICFEYLLTKITRIPRLWF